MILEQTDLIEKKPKEPTAALLGLVFLLLPLCGIVFGLVIKNWLGDEGAGFVIVAMLLAYPTLLMSAVFALSSLLRKEPWWPLAILELIVCALIFGKTLF